MFGMFGFETLALPQKKIRVSKNNIRLLPQRNGIYFLFDSNGKLKYIGTTSNLQIRIQSHVLGLNSAFKINEIKFISFWLVPHTMSWKKRYYWEKKFIQKYQPEKNSQLKT